MANRALSGDHWKKLCRRIERLGFATVHLSDHFNDQLAPMPALAAAAAVTTTLRVGTLVLANDFRHPTRLAKEVATIDLLSGGRMEWGMGAGWIEGEYTSVGLPFEAFGVRVGRLEEAVDLMKGLFAGGVSNHTGTHYRTAGLTSHPQPVQRPHPRLLIGGGSRRLLSLAARQADIVGWGPNIATNPVFADGRVPFIEAADRQLGWIREAAGDRLEQLELHMIAFPVIVTDDPDAAWSRLAAAQRLAVDELQTSPHLLIGSVDQICETLEDRRRRLGVSYWSVPVEAMDAFAPVVDRLREQ